MEKPDLNQINELLSRGTVDIIDKKDLEKKLLSGKKLNIKLGIDPSGSDIHIGHMVVIRKLQEFQKLGHNIYLLFGNFTGQIGDPTGKDETRTTKTQEELEANAKHYLDQVKKVLDINNVEVVWNADWLGKLTFADVTKLAAQFTVAQMMERDMFQERVKNNQPISVHEFMYPLMQGYDSVALKADVELGGTDQTFNLLAGRTLQKAFDQRPQDIITVPILEGTDGNLKMGKSTNNYIGVNEAPKEMYGKVMSVPDKVITRYFELATSVPADEIKKIEESLKKGQNPRDAKMRLAREIVTIYHDEDAAKSAEQELIEVFAKKSLTNDNETKNKNTDSINIVELLSQTNLTSSKSEARRLIDGGGVRVDNEKIESQDLVLSLEKEKLIQVGKRKFLKVIKET